MAEVIMSESLIALEITETQKEGVVKVLAEQLEKGGYVRVGFYEDVIQRENEYPTGLPTSIPVALCHTDARYVIQNAMAVGTLAKPVDFKVMGDPEKHIQAEIIFLLALKDPKVHIPFLNKLFSIFKNQEILETIRQARDEIKLADFLEILF